MQATITARYIAEEKLGQGGMGIVYRAYDRLTGQKVALKQVHAPLHQLSFQSKNDQDEYRLALTREFQTLASLRHPHIISVLDYGFSQDNQPYFTMTLIDTPQSLRVFAFQKTLSEKVQIVIQILQAVAYLHQRGILHRDLKPGNILVANGQVKVLDFGLAVEHSSERSTAGTIAYMAPEMLVQGYASQASDLYAIGIIAYELLVGRYPFSVVNNQPVIAEILTQMPDLIPLEKLQNQLSPMLNVDENEATVLLHPEKTTPANVEPSTILLGGQDETQPPRPVDVSTTRTASANVGSVEQSDNTTHVSSRSTSSQSPASSQGKSITLATIVGKLLAKTPENRYHNANEVIRDLYQSIGQPLPPETADIRESFFQAAKFVGREQEFQTLQSALHEAVQGHGSVWLVGGESGVGKSRLLTELRTYALINGVLVVRGQGTANGSLAFQLWREILPRLILGIDLNDLEASVLKDLVPNVSELVGRAIPDAPELMGKEGQQRLILTIQSVLQRQPQPVLLLLEDLQWAEESLLPVRQVMVHIEQLPLLIVGNYCHDERPDLSNEVPNANLLALQRLSDESIAQLSASMLGEAGLHADVLNLMTRETEGNTFFMIEVARTLAEEAGTLSAIGQITLPEKVFTGGMAHLLQRRLDRISPDYRAVQSFAAVAGRQLDLTLLKQLTSETAVEAWLYEGQAVAVLEVQDDTWQFTHDKLREAVLHGLDNRAVLHQQVAKAIENFYDTKDYAEVLMHHWQAASDPEKELHYLLIVAEEMITYSARYEQARNLLEHGMTVAEPSSSWFHLLGLCDRQTGNYEKAIHSFEHSLVKVENIPTEIELLNDLAFTLYLQGNYSSTIQYAEQALNLARQGNYTKGIASSLNHLGAVSYYQGRFAEAHVYFAEALSIRESLEDLHDIASSLHNLGSLAIEERAYIEAQMYLADALSISQTIGDQRGIADVLNGLGMVTHRQDMYVEAHEYYQEALSIQRTIGDRYAMAISLNNLGDLASEQGIYEKAQEYFKEALFIHRTIGDQLGIALVLLNFVQLRLKNRNPSVIFMIQEALTILIDLKVIPYILVSLIRVAWWQLNQGNVERATEWLGFIVNHPHCIPEIKEDAQPVLGGVQAVLSAEEIEVAMERGKQMTMEEAIDQAFAELGSQSEQEKVEE